jgi:hypothetical protein
MRYDLPMIQAVESALHLVQGANGSNKGKNQCRDGGVLNHYTTGAYEVDE